MLHAASSLPIAAAIKREGDNLHSAASLQRLRGGGAVELTGFFCDIVPV